MDMTGLTVTSDMKYAMHDSLYSNPEQADAYDEASKLNVDGLAYAIWKLGWDDQVDGWVYDEELGWQPEQTLQAIREYEEQESAQDQEAEDQGGELTLSDFERQVDEAAEDSDEGPWVYYIGPDGGEGWQDMSNPTDVRYQTNRPGPAPEGGDGKGDYLVGWQEPPEDASKLSEGQLLEIQLGDREPEVAVVESITGGEVSIQTKSVDYLFVDDNSIAVLAVEDRSTADKADVPDWADLSCND